MFTNYVDCEIEVLPRSHGLFPILFHAPGGDAQGTLRLSADDPAFQALASRLRTNADENASVEIGRMLFNALFQGTVKDVFTRSQGLLQPGQGMRLRLNITPTESAIAALPWELLYDPDQGPLALLDTPVVRYSPLSMRMPVLKADLPLKVLLTGAQTLPTSDVESELHEIAESLSGLGQYIETTIEPHLTVVKLQQLLRSGFHIWHFVGDSQSSGDEAGTLNLEHPKGGVQPISPQELGILLNRSTVRLAVLEMCAHTWPVLSSLHLLASALIQAQVPAAIAMQLLSTEAAQAFASEFYRCLAEGLPIDACTTEGRRAVMNTTGLERADWSIPVLYTRAQDGRLFDLPPAIGATMANDIVYPAGRELGDTRIAIDERHNVLLYQSPPLKIERYPDVPPPPLPMRDFRDRISEQNELKAELKPRGGAWVHGPAGCGRSALLRQITNLPEAQSLPEGTPYITGAELLSGLRGDSATAPSRLDEVAQRLFDLFYHCSDETHHVHMPLQQATPYLRRLRALFVLDDLPLSQSELSQLRDTLANGAMLVATDHPGPRTMANLPLRGLPRQEAISVFMAEAQLGDTQLETAALFERLCDALDNMPLPLLLAARIIHCNIATLPQLLAVLDEIRRQPAPILERAVGENDMPRSRRAAAEVVQEHSRDPLALAARLSLHALKDIPNGLAALAALVRCDGQDADLAALTSTAELPRTQLESALEWLCDLGLAESNSGRYGIVSKGLRHILDQLLPESNERKRSAAYYAIAAALRPGDLIWLGREASNLMAAIQTSLATGQAAQVGALAQALQPWLVLGGQWDSWSQITAWAEQAAKASGDRALRAWVLHERGTRASLLGDRETAARDLTEARRIRLDLGDQAGAAATSHNMAYLRLPLTPIPPRPIPSWVTPLVVTAVMLVVLVAGILVARAGPKPLTAAFAAEPRSGSYPLAVNFDAGASSGPESNSALTYIWDFGDGTPPSETTSVTTTHTYPAPGIYTATLTLRGAQDQVSDPATQLITVINAPPKPSIELPVSTTRFGVGQELRLRGSAMDTEDGRLSEAALSWIVMLHHGDHSHMVLSATSGNDVTFDAPPPEDLAALETSYLEIQLSATDSHGASGVITQTLRPNIVALHFATEPTGLHAFVNGRTITAPAALSSWEGYQLNVAAAGQADATGRWMAFDSWSDGGAATHTITTPAATATYTATFKAPTIAFGAASFSANEDDRQATIAVTLDHAAGQPLTITYATADGTAEAGKDYSATSGELTFAPGETSQTFTVPIVDDALHESDETVVLNLGGANNPLATATLAILDNDPAPNVTFSNANFPVSEGDGQATITVKLSGQSGQPVTVEYATADDTAVAGGDYIPTKGTLTFAPGRTSQSFSVPINNDTLPEPTDVVRLRLSNPVNAGLGDPAAATLTIRDDDPIKVAFTSASYSESESPLPATVAVIPRTATILVELNAASTQPVTVAYATSDGTATASKDYRPAKGVLTFAPGETSASFGVVIIHDLQTETNETVNLTLSNPTNAAVGDPAAAVLTILDDDQDRTAPKITKVSADPDPFVASGECNVNDKMTIQGAVSDPSGVASVTLHYRYKDGDPKIGATSWRTVPMSAGGGDVYAATINVGDELRKQLKIKYSTIEYFLTATDKAGNSDDSQAKTTEIWWTLIC
jgi:PKD repeat protein